MGAMVWLKWPPRRHFFQRRKMENVLKSRCLKERNKKVYLHRALEELLSSIYQSEGGLWYHREGESGGNRSLAVLGLWMCLGHRT